MTTFGVTPQPRAIWRIRLAVLAILTMEALALFVLGTLLAGIGGHAGPSLVTILLAALAGYALVRFLQRFDLPRRPLIVAGGCASVLGLWILWTVQFGGGPLDLSPLGAFTSDPARELNRHTPELFGVVVIGIAWVRGALIGSRPQVTHRAVLASMTVGLGIVVVGISIGRAAIASRAIDNAALPFFVAALVALALIQLSQSEHIQGDTWRGPWLVALAGTIGALALVGGLAGLLPLDGLNTVLAPVGNLLLVAVDLLLYILVLPIVVVFNWVLTKLLAGRMHPLDFKFQTFQQATRELQHQGHPSGFTLLLVNLGHLLVIAIVAAIVALVLIWVFKRVEREEDVEIGEHEPFESRGALRSDLQGLLEGLLSRFRRPARQADPALSPRLLALRRLYLSMLRRSEARGLSRPTAATPREFAPLLERQLDSSLPADLSARFSGGRYGLIEPSEHDLRRLEEAARRVR
ncbi:MAG TPA: DUF4129 domain-containing protein [Dehalococcoidia bacterium]|nr:DUF4129 domain-containing protein [Dehalococcoidia bacterium]